MAYITLFFVAFVSGSLLPLGSEALFLYDVNFGYNTYLILISASIGNTLGAVFNYYLGLKGEEFLEKRKILKKEQINRAKDRFKKYGFYALLLSPLPIIGDPITFIAGAMSYNFKKFFIVVLFAKTFRYILLLSGFWIILD